MFVMTLCIVFSVLTGIDESGVLLVWGFMVLAPYALLSMFLAVFIEKKLGTRSWLWLLTAGSLALLGVLTGVSGLPGSSNPNLFSTALCCLPFVFIAFLISLFYAFRAAPVFQADLHNDRIQRTREVLDSRDEASFSELGAEIGLPPEAIPPFLLPLINSGALSASYALETRRVYTLNALLVKQRRLVAAVQAHGQANLADLASELQVPISYLKQWVMMLSSTGGFSGFIDWQSQVLASRQFEALAASPNCPKCGGVLALAGQGLIECPYCGTGIFLPVSASEPPALDERPDQNRPPLIRLVEPASMVVNRKPARSDSWRLFKPSNFNRAFNLLLLLFLGAGLVCSFSIYATTPGPDGIPLSLFTLGFLDLPVVAVLLIISAVRETRYPPRLLFWSSALGALSVAILLVLLAMWSDPAAGPGLSISSLVYFAAPLVSLLSIPVVYTGIKAWPDISQVLSANQTTRLVRLVRQQGELSFDQIATALSMPVDQVDNLLDSLLQSGQISGTLNTPYQRFYSSAEIAEKHASLLILVKDNGQISLASLSDKLHAPPGILREWIYQMVQMGRFKGYINWNEGMLYSTAAEKIGADSRCPSCGGVLKIGAGNIVHCQHCASEIFG